LTHENLEVSCQKDTLFGVSGSAVEIHAETDLTPDWNTTKVDLQAEFANEKVAVRAKGEAEWEGGIQSGEVSVVGQYKSFHFGVRPTWEAEEEGDGKKALDFAVLYRQPDYQVQGSASLSHSKAGVSLDWFQQISDWVGYTLHVGARRNNETGSYCGTLGQAGGKWKWDDNTQLQGRVSVSRKKDKKPEMRADLAVTQSLSSNCKATLYADVNLLKVTSGNSAPGLPHAFAVELKLKWTKE